MAFLEIEDLSFTYNGAERKALDGVDLRIGRGEFVLLCGKSGCGKSTLLRLIKRGLAPVGKTEGSIKANGKAISEYTERESLGLVGMVMQDPDSQIVTGRVWHELAFGLENLGENTGAIRRKIAEICGFLGIGELFLKDTGELSGGEKQLVCLASVLATDPQILLLDEPSAQLDPISAENLMTLLGKLALENGTTVILAEHRVGTVFPLCDRVVVMDNGRIISDTSPEATVEVARGIPAVSGFLPPPAQLFCALGAKGKTSRCPEREAARYSETKTPLGVRDGRNFVSSRFLPVPALVRSHPKTEKTILSAEKVSFRYARNAPDALSDVSLSVNEKEFLCILGENGSGKSTLLKVFAALIPCVSGKVTYKGKNTAKMKTSELYRHAISYLPQDPRYVFCKATLEDDLLDAAKRDGRSREDTATAVREASERLGVSHLLGMHPYDLSGGETERAAIAKLLLSEPEILLLDEPSKGLDPYAKAELGKLLRTLTSDGLTVVAVTHDTEFAASYAERCALLFCGTVMNVTDTNTFFSENNYYTTAFSKMTRDICPNAVTLDDALEVCSHPREGV